MLDQNFLGNTLLSLRRGSSAFASVTIALDKPFAIGDFITIDDVMGTVEHVGLKTTRLRSLSGEQITQDTPASKLALIPAIIHEAIAAQPKTRFERAHFKKYGEGNLIFEAAFYFGDPGYTLYMDPQQAINLAIHRRLQQEAIISARPTPTIDSNERAQGSDASDHPAMRSRGTPRTDRRAG